MHIFRSRIYPYIDYLSKQNCTNLQSWTAEELALAELADSFREINETLGGMRASWRAWTMSLAATGVQLTVSDYVTR